MLIYVHKISKVDAVAQNRESNAQVDGIASVEILSNIHVYEHFIKK